MEIATERKEVLEFKFSRLCNLRLFPSTSKLDRKYPLNVVATSNKYGLIFAGTPSGVICIPLSNVIELQQNRSNNRGNIENYQRRELKLGCAPSHVAVNSSGDLLAVVISHQDCPVVQIYVVQSFANQNVAKISEMRLSSTPGTRVLDLHWNPAIGNMIGAVINDGSAIVCEINLTGGSPTISSAPPSAQAMCLCWSPKGKQVVLGSKVGSLTQYKPDLKPVKSYPPPQIPNAQLEILAIHWLSSFQFIAVYKSSNDPQGRSFVMIVNVPKNGPQTFVNFEDVCFGSDTLRPEHFFIHVAVWNILIISTGNGLEVSVLRQEGEKWVQWMQDEGGRAELPQTETHDDVYTVGMALNFNATQPIPVGDSGSIPPMPYLLYMSEEGVLCIFHTINILPDATTVCSAPQELPRQFFTVAESGEPAAQTQMPSPALKPAAGTPASMGIGSGEAVPSTQAMAKTSSPFFTPTSGSLFQLPGSQPAQPGMHNPQIQSPSVFQMSPFGTTGSLGSQNSQAAAQPKLPQTSQTQPFVKPPQAQITWGAAPQKGAPVSILGSPASKPLELASGAAPSLGLTPGLQNSALQMSKGVPSLTPVPSIPKVQPLTSTSSPITPAPVASPALSSQPALAPKEPAPTPAVPPPMDDSIIEKEIAKEVASIENLLSSFKVDTTAVNKLINDKTSLASVTVKLDGLEKFEKELRETTTAEHAEVRALRANLIEMWGWLENIKAKQRQSTSQRYLDTVESKELDPLMKKLMKSIDQNTLYVETKIKEATDHLNSIWEKQKEPGSVKNFDIPHMEVIYQTMAANMKILAVQQTRVSELESKLASTLKARKKTIPQVLNDSNPKWNSSHWSSLNNSDQNSQLEKLADKLLQTRLDSNTETSRSFKETANRYIALSNMKKPLSSEKEAALWRWHKSHKVVHTKVARATVPDNELLNRLSLKITPVKTPVSTMSSAPIVETPMATSLKPISRNLFVTPAVSQPTASAPQIFPPLVTSTPFTSQAKTDEPKGTERGFLSPIPQSNVPVSVSKLPVTVEPKGSVSQAPAPKTVFGSPFSAISSKDQYLSSTQTITQADVSSFQVPSSKPLSSEISTSSPFSIASSKSKELHKTIVPSSKENQPHFGSEPTKTTPASTMMGLLSGSTMTVAPGNKEKTPTPAAAGSMFGNSSFGQAGGAPPFQIGSSPFGSMSATTSSVVVTSAAPAVTKSSIFSHVGSPVSSSLPSVSIFSLGSSTTPASETKTTTSTTSQIMYSAPASSQSSFLFGSEFSQSKTTTSVPSNIVGTSTVPIGLSSASIQPASTTSTSVLESTPITISTITSVSTSSSMFGGTPTATSTVTSVSTSNSLQSPTPSVPATTSVSIFGGIVQSPPTVPSPVSPQLVTPEKVASSSGAGSLSFGGMTITPAATSVPSTTSAFSFGSTTFSGTQSSQATTTATSSFSFGTVAFGPTTTTSSLFATTATPATTGNTLFQTPQKSTFSAGQQVFGTPTTSPPTFSTPTTSSQPSFGTPTSLAQSAFGTATTSAQSTFGTSTTSTQPAFGTTTATTQPAFGATSPTSQPSFGTPTTSIQPTFGASTTSAQSTFGTLSTSSPAFGTQPTSSSVFSTTTSPSVFGTPTTSTASVFGAATALSNTSFFGSPATTSVGFGSTPSGSIFGGTSSFSTPSTTSSSIFGAPICSPNSTSAPTNKNVFGSPFESTNTGATAFGGTPSFGSFRSNSPGAFGTSGGSIFGGGSSTFGQPQQGGGLFQSGNASQSVFGAPNAQQQSPGTFSSGGQGIQQTGFGGFGAAQPQQTNNRPFGSSGGAIFGGQAAFGSAPTFGGTATFGGSPTNKIFGSPTTPAAPAFGSPTQQSSTFENLAGQNTVSFGNLAQNQQPTFGAGGASAFGLQQQPQQQQQIQQQQQPAFASTPSFGGTSFSSWR